MERFRRSVVRTARRVGLEPQLRAVQHALSSTERKRDLRDNERLRLFLALCLPEDANCIDVGANVGSILESMVACAPRGRHIAFEPLSELAEALTERFPSVDVRPAALSDRGGRAAFHHIKQASTRSSLDPLDYHDDQIDMRTVPIERLDDVLPGGYVPHFIKVDVEGAEGGVFRGALATLRAHQPTVVFEHTRHAAYFGTTTQEIYEILHHQARLRIFDIDGKGPYGLRELAERVRRGDMWTFVARR